MTPLERVCNSKWESFSSWCGERGQNPVRTSVKHVLDFLQLKTETLAVNTLKGYATAISCRHAMVRGITLSLDPSIRRWIKGLEHTSYDNAYLVPGVGSIRKNIETCHLKVPDLEDSLLAGNYLTTQSF